VEVIHLLQAEGANVKAFEPFKPNADLPGVTAVPSLAAALKDAAVVILLVNHTELRALTPEKLVTMTPARILVDTVNGWAGKDWKAAGFNIHSLGVNK